MDKKLFKSILLLITYAVVLVLVLARLNVIGGAVMWVLGLLQPLLIGFAIAFVLNRPCHFFHRLYQRGLGNTRAKGACRPLAVLSSYLALILVIAAIFAYVLPKFAESIQTFVLNLSGYLTNLQTGYNDIIGSLNLDAESLDLSWLNEKLSGLFDKVLQLLSDTGPQLVASVTSGLVSAVVTGVLAVVFSIYMLSGQEKLMRQCRRVFRAYVPARIAGPIGEVTEYREDQRETHRRQDHEREGQVRPQGADPPGAGGRHGAPAPPVPGCRPAGPDRWLWRRPDRGRRLRGCPAGGARHQKPAEAAGHTQKRADGTCPNTAERRVRRSLRPAWPGTDQDAGDSLSYRLPGYRERLRPGDRAGSGAPCGPGDSGPRPSQEGRGRRVSDRPQ